MFLANFLAPATVLCLWLPLPTSPLPPLPSRTLCMQIIPPEEIAVSFDDIGALEAVKTTLHEVGGRKVLVGGLGAGECAGVEGDEGREREVLVGDIGAGECEGVEGERERRLHDPWRRDVWAAGDVQLGRGPGRLSRLLVFDDETLRFT